MICRWERRKSVVKSYSSTWIEEFKSSGVQGIGLMQRIGEVRVPRVKGRVIEVVIDIQCIVLRRYECIIAARLRWRRVSDALIDKKLQHITYHERSRYILTQIGIGRALRV